jgi:hypothetical protein
MLIAACAPTPVTPVPDASDAAPGVSRSYRCTVSEGGAYWTCSDGVTTPTGTCASYGCVPTP